MALSKKEINEKVAVLEGSNEESQLQTVDSMRKNGDAQLIYPMIDLLGRTNNNQLIGSIIGLLNDLHDPSAVEPLVSAVEKRAGGEQFKWVVSSCWQNRLDFTPGIEVFMDVLHKDDFETAIEAFTVIEETLENLNQEQLKACHKLAKTVFINTTETKRELVNELIKSIESFM